MRVVQIKVKMRAGTIRPLSAIEPMMMTAVIYSRYTHNRRNEWSDLSQGDHNARYIFWVWVLSVGGADRCKHHLVDCISELWDLWGIELQCMRLASAKRWGVSSDDVSDRWSENELNSGICFSGVEAGVTESKVMKRADERRWIRWIDEWVTPDEPLNGYDRVNSHR